MTLCFTAGFFNNMCLVFLEITAGGPHTNKHNALVYLIDSDILWKFFSGEKISFATDPS